MMKIQPEVSNVVDSLVTPSNNEIPIISTQLAESTVMVKNNATIIMGGLRSDEKTYNSKQTPILSKLPFFGEMLKKHFYYGSLMPDYLKRHPVDGTARFAPLRPAYFRNWRLFVRDPVHGVGLVVMKGLQYFVAGAGFLWGLLRSKKKDVRGRRK